MRGGLVIDGTGAPPRLGDVAIRDGKLTAVGDIAAGEYETLDASGCWVTPGFVDPHTHLDAQLCWDPTGSPSNSHGVTTVILGLCGFGVAPCGPGAGEYLLRSLEVVEEIPYASTVEGVGFEWSHWSEYRDHLSSRPLAVNAAGFVPHSALRVFAMGDRARTESATPADRAAMVAELESALAAGALGFATSRGPNHVDGYNQPVPSRLADEAELRALVSACSGRVWQVNVETKFSHDAASLKAEVEKYAAWSRAADATLTWTPLHCEPGETVWQEVLDHNRELNASGVRVAPQVTPVPITVILRFDERSMFPAIIGWEDVLSGFYRLAPHERLERLADPRVRAVMRAAHGPAHHPLTADFELWSFAVAPTRPELCGVSLQAAADARGVHPVDLLCDQVIADELRTLIDVPVANRDVHGAVHFIEDPLTLVGLGDSGAHVMSVTNYRYPTYLLADVVQRRGALPLEVAVNRLTASPAALHGLTGRGTLEPGQVADVCVIDPDRIGLGEIEVHHDLPGNSPRLLQPGRGYRAVYVNGVRAVADDETTGRAAGMMLAAAVTPR